MNVLKFTKYTNTTKFILPLLFEDNIKYHEIFNNFFINAYIADMANDENDDKIHLLFADYPSLTLQQTLPDPIAEYTYKDGFVLIYELDPKWADDYIKIITGDYSTVSEEAKERMLTFWEEDNTSLLWGVLYKRGNVVREHFEKFIGKKLYGEWTKDKEWWLPYEIADEVLKLV